MPSALTHLHPMRLDRRPFNMHEPGWNIETRFEGCRMLAEFGQGRCLLKTSAGANATSWFPEITRALSDVRAFPAGPYVVDGSVCVLDAHGASAPERLARRIAHQGWYGGCDRVTFCVFDLLTANGADRTADAHVDRKARLARLLQPAPPGILYVSHRDLAGSSAGHDLSTSVVAKKATSVYRVGEQSADWVALP